MLLSSLYRKCSLQTPRKYRFRTKLTNSNVGIHQLYRSRTVSQRIRLLLVNLAQAQYTRDVEVKICNEFPNHLFHQLGVNWLYSLKNKQTLNISKMKSGIDELQEKDYTILKLKSSLYQVNNIHFFPKCKCRIFLQRLQ